MIRRTKCFHPEEDPAGHRHGDESHAQDRFPFTRWSFDFGKSLTERCAVQSFLLFDGKFAPVSCFFALKHLKRAIKLLVDY